MALHFAVKPKSRADKGLRRAKLKSQREIDKVGLSRQSRNQTGNTITAEPMARHGTWEGDESDIRRIDPNSGAVLERLEMPRGIGVSGLESDGADLFYCGGGRSGKVRTVRRPKAARS